MKRMSIVLAAVALAAGIAAPSLLAAVDVPLHNWPVPTSQRGGARTLGTLGTLTDVRSPSTFVPMAPCRVVDTRGTNGTFGGPIMPGLSTRTFPIPTGPCTGIASNPAAYSLNFTVVNMEGFGFLTTFPTGTTRPIVSTLDYVPVEGALANAAIVPAGTGNSINVYVSVTTHVLIDINGYFLDSFSTINPNEFVGMTGSGTGFCGLLFVSNTTTSTNACTSSVRGVIGAGASNGAAVLGEHSGITAGANGVRGSTNSDVSNGAGVLGTTGYTFLLGFSTSGAGVRGQGRNGVVGATSQTTGNVGEGGVIGIVSPNGGGLGPYGYLGYAPTNKGVFSVGDMATTGAKPFMDPHPTDPTKMIEYIALEGNESGTYFRGTAHTNQGTAIIDVPEDFRLVTDSEGLSVQLTPVGAPATMYVESENLNQIIVHSNRDVKFHYMVNGVRLAFKDHKVIQDSFGTFVPLNPEMTMSSAFAPEQKRRLIANGTFNPDGKVNLETARAVGWDKIWQQRAVKTDQPAPASNKPD